MLWRPGVLGGSLGVHEVHEYHHGEEPDSNVYAGGDICQGVETFCDVGHNEYSPHAECELCGDDSHNVPVVDIFSWVDHVGKVEEHTYPGDDPGEQEDPQGGKVTRSVVIDDQPKQGTCDQCPEPQVPDNGQKGGVFHLHKFTFGVT